MTQTTTTTSGGGRSLETMLIAQRQWSGETFGPGRRTEGLLAHIRSELDEIANNPTDVTEWVDVVILALDGAWRAGHEPTAIVGALEAKYAENRARTWPDWRTAAPGQPIEHVRGVDSTDEEFTADPGDTASGATRLTPAHQSALEEVERLQDQAETLANHEMVMWQQRGPLTEKVRQITAERDAALKESQTRYEIGLAATDTAKRYKAERDAALAQTAEVLELVDQWEVAADDEDGPDCDESLACSVCVKVEQGQRLRTILTDPSKALAQRDAQAATRALTEAREDIRSRRLEFRRLGADEQYLSALDDAFGLINNRIKKGCQG